MQNSSILVIGSFGALSTILVFAKSPDTMPGDLAGHRFPRLKGQVQCLSFFGLLAHMPGCPVLDRNNKLILSAAE